MTEGTLKALNVNEQTCKIIAEITAKIKSGEHDPPTFGLKEPD